MGLGGGKTLKWKENKEYKTWDGDDFLNQQTMNGTNHEEIDNKRFYIQM